MTITTTDETVRVPPIGRYGIDNQSSTITFRSRHLLGLAPVRGTQILGVHR
jgi:hypothetical protein